MADPRIQGYAAAILEVAKAEDSLDRVQDELFRVAQTFESSTELRDALSDPRLPSDRKQAIVDDLLGGRANPLTVGFVNFVVGLGRASDFPAIARELVARAAGERDKVVGEVRSAVALDDATVERLSRALSKRTGKNVEVKVTVDPSIVGGLVAQVGDVVIDGSVRGRLENLRETLIG
jgi:F-type H+-transporting ATPase subunit delta